MKKPPEFLQVPFGSITPWEKNPRNIKKEKLELLAESIEKYGLFQTLTTWQENGKNVTGGGNMRYQAMKHVLNWPEDKPVWISRNFPENEKEKIELALLDNMVFGIYEDDKLAELVYPYKDEIQLENFEVNLAKPVDLKEILGQFASIGEEPPDPDPPENGEEKEIICPKCGFKWRE
jgi:hypothetical protein